MMMMMMVMVMMMSMITPMMTTEPKEEYKEVLPQRQKKLYYGVARHSDPVIDRLLKNEGIQIHDYVSAFDKEQAQQFLRVRYPGYEISRVRELTVFLQKYVETIEPVEFIPVDPLHAADDWASLSPERRTIIEKEASLAGEDPYMHFLKTSGAYEDWVKLRTYYDAVEETTRKYEAGEIEYPTYPPFPTLKKPLVAVGPSGYPVRVEECAGRHSLEELRRLAGSTGVKLAGGKKDLCWNLINAGTLL